MSGSNIYKYTATNVGIQQPTEQAYPERIEVRPNMMESATEVLFNVKSTSKVIVEVYIADVKLMSTIFQGRLQGGDHRYPLERGDLASGANHITLRTNEWRTSAAFQVS